MSQEPQINSGSLPCGQSQELNSEQVPETTESVEGNSRIPPQSLDLQNSRNDGNLNSLDNVERTPSSDVQRRRNEALERIRLPPDSNLSLLPQLQSPSSPDSGPCSEPLQDLEKQLLFSIIQEVNNFEVLKDIRNELKDSKKDLEGRLYGYNPDFANLIASAEEFVHGKSSCLEPSPEEIDIYKTPVSLVYSEAEVKFLKMKPPLYLVGNESPSQVIRAAMEESTKLFLDAVIHTCGGARDLPLSPLSHKTKVIVVIEDNNEVLELLTVALWFFEKTPLATFQAKFCHNTTEFMLSLDACRLYFGSYPVGSTKKDDEHLFERWLGVGINGVLRKFQSKILLIDFPRPGTNLQNSKNVLHNRLKLEEKLHNIKSLSIGKASRKEDNLSTVEHILDEIQKCLEPRDRLLFRKARRIYLDLKLYKQIEQKSRQDLKSNRDWGIPEPDVENEHELWERFHSSEIVVNNVSSSVVNMNATNLSTEVENQPINPSPREAISNAQSDADLSETHSTHSAKEHCESHLSEEEEDNSCLVEKNEIPPHEQNEAKFETEDANMSNFNSHEQILDSLLTHELEHHEEEDINDGVIDSEMPTGDDNDKDSLQSDEYISQRTDEKEPDILVDIQRRSNSEDSDTSGEAVAVLNRAFMQKEKAYIPVDSSVNSMETPRDEVSHSENELNAGSSKMSISESLVNENSSFDYEQREVGPAIPLKRSAGFFDLIHGDSVRDRIRVNEIQRDDSDSDSLDEDPHETHDPQTYTRFEFTLAANVTSEEGSSLKSLPLQRILPFPESSDVNHELSGSLAEEPDLEIKQPFKSKSLHESCKAYFHKLGKSVSQILRKPKSRRIFPEHLTHANLATGKVIARGFLRTPKIGKPVRYNEDRKLLRVASRDSGKKSIHRKWLHTLNRIFRAKNLRKK